MVDTTLFYKKGYKTSALAIIEDSCAIKDGSCVLGVEVIQGSFQEGNLVEVIDEEVLFDCIIADIEQTTGCLKIASADQKDKYGAHFGLWFKDYTKEEFEKEYQLRK